MRSKAAIVAASMVFGLFLAAIPVILESPSAEAAERTNAVDVNARTFFPADIVILVETAVTWTQKSTDTHTITEGASTDTQHDFDGIILPPSAGVNQAFTSPDFDTVGTFNYFCRIHGPGMAGTIEVVASFPVETPAVFNITATSTNGTKFNPSYAEIDKGTTVNWTAPEFNATATNSTNATTTNHSITFENATIGDLGDFSNQTTISHMFNQNGSFRYRCKFHSEDNFEVGMVGKIVVGGPANFSNVLVITYPKDDGEVNGTVNITGKVFLAIGQPQADRVELRFNQTGNWTPAVGVENWTYEWDTEVFEHGEHNIYVRALVNTTVVDEEQVEVHVHHHDEEAPKKKKGLLPGFELLLVPVALLGAAWVLRRRR